MERQGYAGYQLILQLFERVIDDDHLIPMAKANVCSVLALVDIN
jgi:hypothetical protein